MTNREKKAYLRGYRALDRRVNSRIEELAVWRSRAEKVTPSITDMPKGAAGDRIQDAIDNICRIEEEIRHEIDAMNAMRANVMAAISSVDDDRMRSLLELRYIYGLSWERIAVEMNYDYRWVTRLHGRALDQIRP